MNFVAVAIVSAIVLGHLFNKSLLIGLNCILLCSNSSNQISKYLKMQFLAMLFDKCAIHYYL